MYDIFNRRYTGSKYKLRSWINDLICENCNGDSFFDVFAGTGVVTYTVISHFQKLILNDFLFSNEIIYRAFFQQTEYNNSLMEGYETLFKNLKSNDIDENYFSTNFGGKFFNHCDSKIIGHIREIIEVEKSSLNDKEFAILVASLLYSADRCANTVGHYDAYIKDKPIPQKFEYSLITPKFVDGKEIEIYRQDANELAENIKADICYIDPPYNSRQYSRFYHILENLTQWEKPNLTGIALKPHASNMSDYCRCTAPEKFNDLIKKLNCEYIVVSYNNTYASKSNSSRNKIELDYIEKTLNSKGSTKVFEKPHQCFNTGKTEFADHKEFLFITKVGA
ncbi:hypothetical protein FACS1894188_05260 [Clostridia bacterium]|nr:hypothetical protein FACS1894188_05260 [Clostridia bacterium]